MRVRPTSNGSWEDFPLRDPRVRKDTDALTLPLPPVDMLSSTDMRREERAAMGHG